MDNPSYYSILTSDVRYDKELSSSQKIFYSEITSLTNKKGYCYASNSYFAELYGVARSTISHWVKSLEKRGHIRVEYDRNGKHVKERKIYLLRGGQNIDQVVKKSKGGGQEIEQGWSKNPKDNNTSINNKDNNNDHLEKKDDGTLNAYLDKAQKFNAKERAILQLNDRRYYDPKEVYGILAKWARENQSRWQDYKRAWSLGPVKTKKIQALLFHTFAPWAVTTLHRMPPEQLMKKADNLMYRNKKEK